MNAKTTHMTYEGFLDEVTTLITEKYEMADEAAIKMVMRAQADDFFSGHDDDPRICTQDRAHEDARAVFKKYKQETKAVPPKKATPNAGQPQRIAGAPGRPAAKVIGKPKTERADPGPGSPPAPADFPRRERRTKK